MFSDAVRLPDWRAALSRQPRHVGLVLRDYHLPQRQLLAAEMAKACRKQGRALAIAGDRALAQRFHAQFHCPSYLISRAAARGGVPKIGDMAAVHNMMELSAAHKAGFDTVFISPVFETASHKGARGLGAIRGQYLFELARRLRLRVYALGGMNPQHYQRLGGAQAIYGWAAIDYFADAEGA